MKDPVIFDLSKLSRGRSEALNKLARLALIVGGLAGLVAIAVVAGSALGWFTSPAVVLKTSARVAILGLLLAAVGYWDR